MPDVRAFRRSVSEPARAAVLVAHGLNNRPEVMDPIIELLNSQGFHTLRLSFHQGASRTDGPASCWLSEIADGYRQLVAQHPGLPVYNLSFSLGALVTLRFLELDESARFDRMVFLSPAIALTRRATLVRCVTPLRFLNLSLPSVAPQSIRARTATPIAEYATLLDFVGHARTVVSPRIGRIPTAILATPRDELVSFDGLASWMRRNQLANWTLTNVHPDATPAPNPAYWHLAMLETVRLHASSSIHREILSHFQSHLPGAAVNA